MTNLVRREPSATLETGCEWWMPSYLRYGPQKSGLYSERDGFRIDDSTTRELDEGRDRIAPIYLGTDTSKTYRHWWTYCGDFYSTTEELSATEVEALIEEKENRKKLRINRALAVAARANELATPRSRSSIPRKVQIDVWQRDSGRCVECGSNEDLEYDHIVPHSLGGSDSFRNLQLLCETCNRRKGSALGGEQTSADADGGRIVVCPNCGAKNRLRPAGTRHRCGRCKTEIWRGPA